MRAENDHLSFSPSDVTAYFACEHLTQLELKVARGEIVKPHAEDAQAELIRRKGDEHERAYLEQLLADGRDVFTIELAGADGEWDWERAARETEDALRSGARSSTRPPSSTGTGAGSPTSSFAGPTAPTRPTTPSSRGTGSRRTCSSSASTPSRSGASRGGQSNY